MTRLALIAAILAAALSVSFSAHAQSDDAPPYLYYYSHLLGGLVVERADGSDSRLIGADVLPPNIGGPGWSPSGRHFAAYRQWYSDPYNLHGAPYILTEEGKPILLGYVGTVDRMEWSPGLKDILAATPTREVV